MKNYLISLVLVSLSSNALADPVAIKAGEAAPFSGVLFSNDDANALRRDVLERDSLKLINTSLDSSLTLQNDIIARQKTQLTIVMDQNDRLAKSLGSAQSLNTWERVGFISIGLISSGLAFYGLTKIQK